MPIFNPENTSATGIISQVQNGLAEIRAAVDTAGRLYAWSSSITRDDLMAQPPNGPGMTQDTAQAILDACSDAWGLSQLYEKGTDPRTPPPGYIYGASQQRVIGPRIR